MRRGTGPKIIHFVLETLTTMKFALHHAKKELIFLWRPAGVVEKRTTSSACSR
jgi:hypothetical protein